MLALLEEQEARRLKAKKAPPPRIALKMFAREAWPIVEPGTPLLWNWHLDAICDHLEAAADGRIRSLVINIPPRSMKSLLVAVFWPCWVWTFRPESRWMFASYSMGLSVRDSLKRRLIVTSPWYRERWSGIELAGDQNLKSRFENSRRGYMIATSVDSTVTGEGGDFLVVDDAHNVQEAESETVRESTLWWFDNAWSTRGNDPRTVAKVIVGQRVHERDLPGHVLSRGGWDHLCVPMEWDGEHRSRTALGWHDPRIREGDPLWTERFPPIELNRLKQDLGSYGVAGQLQQRPAPPEGGLVKTAWFGRYSWDGPDDRIRLEDPRGPRWISPSHAVRFATVDLAASTRETADYTVVASWILLGEDLVLVGLDRRRLEGPDLPRMLDAARSRWGLDFVAIERQGYQLAAVQQERRRGMPVVELAADRDKVARAIAALPFLEQGRCWLPREAPWLADLEHELKQFPNGAHDDQVDVLVYGVLVAFRYRSAWRSISRKAPIVSVLDERDRAPEAMEGFRPSGASPFQQ